MSIEKIIEQYSAVKESIDQLGLLIEDYQQAKSVVTKKLLASAIEKYATKASFTAE